MLAKPEYQDAGMLVCKCLLMEGRDGTDACCVACKVAWEAATSMVRV